MNPKCQNNFCSVFFFLPFHLSDFDSKSADCCAIFTSPEKVTGFFMT